MILLYVYTVDSGFTDAEKGDGAEYTCVRKMGAPVPAKHIVGFSEVHKTFKCIVISYISVFLWALAMYCSGE